MNPALIEALISVGLNQWADYQDRQAKGTLTDADIDAMLVQTGHNLETLQAHIDAKKK